ncbi:MAG TPA: ABC transporter substrate-binding protein [Methylomirabilota bacterium]|jgi:putative ABC transport system substrate-binding protein|nr:ABC transporter substrate-binding protein [Methylomirabilota bacterium]
MSLRRGLFLAVAAALVAAPGETAAQPPAKAVRIGLLCAVSCLDPPLESSASGKALVQALRDLGYVEGERVIFDFRGAGVRYGRLSRVARELVERKVDLILVAEGSAAARAAQQVTRTIPIVLVGVPDAVELGLVASLARPGGNVTGITLPFTELAGKQLEFVKEAVPGLTRVAVLSNPDNPDHGPAVRGLESAARSVRVQLEVLKARGHADFEAAFSAMTRARAGAVLVLPDPVLFGGGQITSLAIRYRVPAVSPGNSAGPGRADFAARGGLMTYGPSGPEMYRRAAVFVDRIVKGTKPDELPVEQPSRYELVINMSTARALGLAIPESLILRAERVIR